MKKLEAILKPVYGKETQRILREVIKIKKDFNEIPRTSDNPYWYKFMNLYFIYPDGVQYSKSKTPLQNVAAHINHVSKLGCSAIHILPFLDSPQVDAGFDISNFFKVRSDLGTIPDLKNIIKEAKERDMRVFMDLVFNHISDQHEWFRKACAGDAHYRDYFIHTRQKPVFVKKYHRDNCVWAEYKVSGKKRVATVVFPERAGPLPHWREENGYWYYHTFYPEQLDLNWLNPDVFIEMTKVIMYWTSLGFNFRLDANRYIGKPAYKPDDVYWKENHQITAGLKYLAETINPEVAFLVESYEKLDTVISYFGTSNQIEANLNYNFHLCTNIWVSLIKSDTTFIWTQLEKLNEIPKHGEWVNFLRNHDELSLSYLSKETTEHIQKELLPSGKPFREGFGISGRTFSFLKGSKKRLLMAYFLLASFPGSFTIPYGDEIGSKNVPYNVLSKAKKHDTRNINRGKILSSRFQTKKAKDIFTALTYIIKKRRLLRGYMNVWPERVTSAKEVFSASYKLGSSELRVLINVTPKRKSIRFNTKGYKLIAQINAGKVADGEVILEQYAGVWLQK